MGYLILVDHFIGTWPSSQFGGGIYTKSVTPQPGFELNIPQPESGYIHIHAGYFPEFTYTEKERLKNHWSRVVRAGDYKHGLDFSFKKSYKKGDISSLRNYFMMKYLRKTFIDGVPDYYLKKTGIELKVEIIKKL